ncbi:MAG TPA: hypothetical protein VM285_00035, partial [Polyangia bacterium]|nr:hypothetical protein [Polyangia bacterium]
MSKSSLLAQAAALLAALGLAFSGCDSGGKTSFQDDAGPDGGDTDTGSGTDEDTDQSRGDPEDFPEDCIASCLEACDAIDACGATDNEHFPLGVEDCLERCLMGQDGYMWDDVTGHFRCCATQEECEQVEVCGGWLAHPATVDPCAKLCQCMFSGAALAALWPDVTPPPGYGFAPSMLVVEADAATVDWNARYGARVVSQGRF